MKKICCIYFALLLLGCAVHKVETSKDYYQLARQAEAEGKNLDAIAYWKALLKQADEQIQQGHYLSTNYFLRASAYFELGEWDKGFADLQELDPVDLKEEELWIYPLYAVMLGDYYSQNNMTSVAETFYQSVLKKSSYKTSSVYILALERHVNNSIRAINLLAEENESGEKLKKKEYEDLFKEVTKYAEEFPYNAVPHFLMADLLAKLGSVQPSLEHLLASLELGLPTKDLLHSAEFELASLLSEYKISPALNSTLLSKAEQWWSAQDSSTVFQAGQNTMGWLIQQEKVHEMESNSEQENVKVRYLAIKKGDSLKILTWEIIG
jgi:hypothetical protein